MLQEMYTTLSKPFREEMPVADLLLFTVIYAIIAYVAFDATRIVASYLKSVAD